MNNKVRNLLRYAVMIIALVVFSYSSYKLASIYIGYKEGNDVYKNIQDDFFVPNIDQSEGGDEDNNSEDNNNNIVIEGDGEGQEFVFDFESLKKLNKYAVGWISLDDGEYISYPVLQCEDNDKYLRRLITGKKNTAGSIFVDYRCEGGLDAKNTIIYGHNMRNLSMFGTLKNYYDEPEYYKEHPYFDIWVGEKQYRYYVFSIYHLNIYDNNTYQFKYETDEAFLQYVEERKQLSIVPIDVGEITAQDKIATLSTCVRNHDELRLILHLVRREIPKEE